MSTENPTVDNNALTIKSADDLIRYVNEMSQLHAKLFIKGYNSDNAYFYDGKYVTEAYYVREMVKQFYSIVPRGYYNLMGNNNRQFQKAPLLLETFTELQEFLNHNISFLKEIQNDEHYRKELMNEQELVTKKIASFEKRDSFTSLKEFIESKREEILLQQFESASVKNLISEISDLFKRSGYHQQITNVLNNFKSYRISDVIQCLKRYVGSITNLNDQLVALKKIDILGQEFANVDIDSLCKFYQTSFPGDDSIKQKLNEEGISGKVSLDELIKKIDLSIKRQSQNISPDESIENLRKKQKTLNISLKVSADNRIQFNGDIDKVLSSVENLADVSKKDKEKSESHQQQLKTEKERFKNLSKLLMNSDQDILKFLITEYSDVIKKMERYMDKMALQYPWEQKDIVKNYSTQLNNIYLDIIRKFFAYKRMVSSCLFANGNSLKSEQEISEYNQHLDMVYNAFMQALQTVQKQLKPSVFRMKKLVPGYGIKNVIFFWKKEQFSGKFRIDRHSMVFSNLLAKFDLFYDKLSGRQMSKHIFISSLDNGKSSYDDYGSGLLEDDKFDSIDDQEKDEPGVIDIDSLLKNLSLFSDSSLEQDRVQGRKK